LFYAVNGLAVRSIVAVTKQAISPELLVTLDRDAGGLRAQLEAALRSAVRDGRLTAGARLPATRMLATELGVSRATVTEAYAQLVAEGYLIGRVGAGTSVAEAPRAAATPSPPNAHRPPRAWRYDLRPGIPDLQKFPRRLIDRALRTEVRALADAELDYGDPRGLPRLRVALAAYLGRVRGVAAGPDEIVVSGGFGHGLSLFLDSAPRGPLALEAPGPAAIHEFLSARPLERVFVPVDALGLRVADLGAASARTVLVTPAHQYPTGVVMASERRAELVEWARAEPGRMIVEDDYDAEFRYDRDPVGALQGLAPDVVVHCGSLSKTLAPAMRLGWVVAPPAIASELAARRTETDHHAPTLVQAAFASLLESGDYDRHLRAMRLHYRRRRDALIAEIERRLPSLGVSGAAAGLHFVLELPPSTDAAAVVEAAASRSLRLVPFPGDRAALLVGYGSLPDGAIGAAVAELAAAIRAA
jgi:GntR family transcriptional regulator / MocR family aminotransferase